MAALGLHIGIQTQWTPFTSFSVSGYATARCHCLQSAAVRPASHKVHVLPKWKCSAQGRIFIDRDPQHFGLILNFLRDGTCVLPMDGDARRQILQEADFYQLDSLRAFIMHEDRQELQTAHDLRACIATRLEVPAVSPP